MPPSLTRQSTSLAMGSGGSGLLSASFSAAVLDSSEELLRRAQSPFLALFILLDIFSDLFLINGLDLLRCRCHPSSMASSTACQLLAGREM